MESMQIATLGALHMVYVKSYGLNLYSILEYSTLFPIGIVVKPFGTEEYRPLDNSGYPVGTPRTALKFAVKAVVRDYYGSVEGTDQDIKARHAVGIPFTYL
jgi:hypothetical protein